MTFVKCFAAVVGAVVLYAIVADSHTRVCAVCLRRWAIWTDKQGDCRCRRCRVRVV